MCGQQVRGKKPRTRAEFEHTSGPVVVADFIGETLEELRAPWPLDIGGAFPVRGIVWQSKVNRTWYIVGQMHLPRLHSHEIKADKRGIEAQVDSHTAVA